MELIAVLDLLGGVVVRGIAGERANYRPIQSRLCDSSDPLRVAAAFRARYGVERLYVADLDAIGGSPPAREVYRQLGCDGFSLLVDAGIRSEEDAALIALDVEQLVLGLETLDGPRVLRNTVGRLGQNRVVFSLDLRSGQPICTAEKWGTVDPLSIATIAVDCGIETILLLDLARVGLSGGTGTLDLAQAIRSRLPSVRLILGGGIRDLTDLCALQQNRIDAALLATALHDERVTPIELARFSR